jgi:amino acid transporter
MYKVKLRFTKGLILFITLMSLFAFLSGIKSCHASSISGTEVTYYAKTERLFPLAVFLIGVTVLLLNQKYKESIERILCHRTIAFSLLSMVVLALEIGYDGLVGDTIRIHEEILLQALSTVAGAYLFMIWLYAFILVDRFRKEDRIEWYLGLLFFGVIVAPIAAYKLIPENILMNLNKNKPEPNKTHDQISGTGGATDS